MILDARTRAPDVRLVPLAVNVAAWRRRVIFDCCKWDPQVGDTSTISDHACLLSPAAACHLATLAEHLARETLEMEEALAKRPDLYRDLAIPRRLRPLLAGAHGGGIRVMRFDFHPVEDGWALSEVNSDVPGGYAEASLLPQLAAAHAPGKPAGDVAASLREAFMRALPPGARIALVHATAYSDDRQVMQFLARGLSAAGFTCGLAAPDHLRWRDARPVSIVHSQEGPVDGVIRFYPAEWLPLLPRDSGWQGYFRSPAIMTNPPRALLSQSKRLPLVWDRLGLELPGWRNMLPETRDVRDAPWRSDESWLLKPAMGRVGESIGWRGAVIAHDWRRMSRSATLWPRQWVAQRRFATRQIATRDGPRNLCIGVFTVEGRAAGFYGRLSARHIIEKHAQDIAVLVESDACGVSGSGEDRHVA